MQADLVKKGLDGLLVGFSRGLVLVLVDLVGGSTESTADTALEAGVTNVSLHLLLVGLLAGLRGVALKGFGGIVDSIADRVGDLADDAFVWLVDIWGRHFD